ncbi:MAG: hypothetical protein WCP52_08895 [Bacteroidota bacterium]
MNRRIIVRHVRHYHRAGVGIPVILMAVSTIVLIVLCVYYSI